MADDNNARYRSNDPFARAPGPAGTAATRWPNWRG